MFSLLVWLVCALACFSLGLSCIGLCLFVLIDYFLFHIGEIFTYTLFINFLIPFLFLFFFWKWKWKSLSCVSLYEVMFVLSFFCLFFLWWARLSEVVLFCWWWGLYFCLLFRWGVLHRLLLVPGWCQVLYASGCLCASSQHLIAPRVSSLVV